MRSRLKGLVLILGGAFFALVVVGLPIRPGNSASMPIQNGDVNGDGTLDISDAVFLLIHLFESGPEPVACGESPDVVERIKALERSVVTLVGDVGDVNGELSVQTSRVDELSLVTQEVQDSVASLDESNADLQARVTDLENRPDEDLDEIRSRLTSLESAMVSLAENTQGFGARVFSSTHISIPCDGRAVTLDFDSERWDTGDLHDPGAKSRLTAPVEGEYLIVAHAIANNVHNVVFSLGLNSGVEIARTARPDVSAPGGDFADTVSTVYRLAQGDYVEVLYRVRCSQTNRWITTAEFMMVKLP